METVEEQTTDLEAKVKQLEEDKHALQHALGNVEEAYKELQSEYAVSMSNELTAMRKLLPFLLVENDTLKRVYDNQQR